MTDDSNGGNEPKIPRRAESCRESKLESHRATFSNRFVTVNVARARPQSSFHEKNHDMKLQDWARQQASLNSNSPTVRIAIIGLGPSGLSAALAFQQTFSNVPIVLDLYDKDPIAPTDDIDDIDDDDANTSSSILRRGYGMTLTYNPQTGPLATLRVLEQVAACDTPSRSHYTFSPQGHVLGYYGRFFQPWSSHNNNNNYNNNNNNNNSNNCPFCRQGGSTQRGSIRIPRHVLRKILLQSLMQRMQQSDKEKKNTLTINLNWGKKLVAFTETSDISSPSSSNISLLFQDQTTAHAHFLIGADGLHSRVLHSRCTSPNRNNTKEIQIPDSSPTQYGGAYLGLVLILGITNEFYHPLLDERGFYTVDGQARFFTMPYDGSLLDDLLQFGSHPPPSQNNITKCYHITSLVPKQYKRRYMWQLSFPIDDIQHATMLIQSHPTDLLQYVQQRLQHWHSPIPDMIHATPIDAIWGTPLFDRDPHAISFRPPPPPPPHIANSRVVIMGDAIHAMSPFKGQGCNQALMDGPLLVSWLHQSSMDSAIKGYTREMIARSSKKVADSRQAANFYHSPLVLYQHDFSGVQPEKIPTLLSILKERGIGAHLGKDLDQEVAKIIDEIQGLKVDGERKPRQGFSFVDNLLPSIDPSWTTKFHELCPDSKDPSTAAILYALVGDTEKLRCLSLMDSEQIRLARTDQGMTCLHVAAREGQYFTCRWLLTDYGMSYNTRDKKQQTPLHASALSADPKTLRLLSQVSMHCDECWFPDSDGRTPVDIVSVTNPCLLPLVRRENVQWVAPEIKMIPDHLL